jgi:hypothetical protein
MRNIPEDILRKYFTLKWLTDKCWRYYQHRKAREDVMRWDSQAQRLWDELNATPYWELLRRV